MTIISCSDCDETLTGVVDNFPNRRACHPRLFFIELSLKAGNNDIRIENLQTANCNSNFRIGESSHSDQQNEESPPQNLVSRKESTSKHIIVQVLFKHGQGGSYQNGAELVDLRRDIRQGDTIQVHVGRKEWISKSGTQLFHATQAQITSVMIHGNTGSSYECSCSPTTVHSGAPLAIASLIDDSAGRPGNGYREEGKSPSAEEEKGEAHVPSKKERFAVFCDFLVSTFSPTKKTDTNDESMADTITCIGTDNGSNDNHPTGNATTCHSDNESHHHNLHVYDIAGGRGEMALLLTLQGCQVTLIDPRENSGRLSSRSRKQLRKSGKEPFAVERIFFDARQAATVLGLKNGENHNRSNQHCSSNGNSNQDNDHPETAVTSPVKNRNGQIVVLAGLHPDEVTEAIVDAAVTHRLPFAVVPCCVYSRLFPHRRHQDGQPVRTHERLCQYLQAKAPGIRRQQLSFGGQATVLYHLGDYDC